MADLAAAQPRAAAAAAGMAATSILEVAISVDVVCPDRLAGNGLGFAAAPFPIRVPAQALGSFQALFSTLKLGALADASEVWGSIACVPRACKDMRIFVCLSVYLSAWPVCRL